MLLVFTNSSNHFSVTLHRFALKVLHAILLLLAEYDAIFHYIEVELMAKIQEYRDMGEDAWEYTETCSDFAAAAWEAATGEDLSSWWWTTPSELKDAIIDANGGLQHGVKE